MKQNGKHQKGIVLFAFAMAALFLTGCAGTFPFEWKNKTEQEEAGVTPETLGLAPDFSYERKEERPGVQTNRLGYLPESVKTAVFQGKELPENFQVIAKDSGVCVYEGTVRADGDGEDGALIGYGTFTELKEEGDYYIQCDKIGCSYYFTIEKEAYLEKAKELGGMIEEAQSGQTENGEEIARESMEISEMLSCLLVAYEMYPELLVKIWDAGNIGDAEAGINGKRFFEMLRAKTDLLLSIQDEKTGGVYKKVNTASVAEGNTQSEISGEATAVYAGTMAKYGYLYQEYDWDYANICLKAASKAWSYLEKEEREGRLNADSVATGRIYAAAELYRASNAPSYHNYMLQSSELLAGQKEDIYLLMGQITYLSTRRTVNHELCGQMMSRLMKEAEKIAGEGKTEAFLVGEKETDVILWDMTVLALTNYAIMNYEYVTVIENYLHYLMGRNAESALLLEEPDSVEAAKLLLLFSVVETERKIIEDSVNQT